MAANKFIILTICIAICTCSLQSCIVTKKKYQTAIANGKKSLDSLNSVFNNTVEGFNKTTESLKQYNFSKDNSIDSLTTINNQLNGNTLSLKQELAQAINDFNTEKTKLVAKSHQVDSLMNVLSFNDKQKDSILNSIETQKSYLYTLLTQINSCLKGINQSQAYAEIKNEKIELTIWDNFLFNQNTTTISKNGLILLKKIGSILTLNEDIKVAAIGHTDNTGTAKGNLEFSTKKASAVISTIAENSTTSGKNYTASGQGIYNPIVENNSTENKTKNKRVVLTFSK